MKQLILSSSFVLAVSLAGSALAAEIYRWVDIYGNVYYTDSKPVGVLSEQIEVNVPEEGLVLITPSRRVRQAAVEVQPRSDSAAGAAETAVGTTEVFGPCTRARQQLTLLHTGGPVYRGDGGLWYGKFTPGLQPGRAWLAQDSRPDAISTALEEVLDRCSNPEDVRREIRGAEEASSGSTTGSLESPSG